MLKYIIYYTDLKTFPEQWKRKNYVDSETEYQALPSPSRCIVELTLFDRTKVMRNNVT